MAGRSAARLLVVSLVMKKDPIRTVVRGFTSYGMMMAPETGIKRVLVVGENFDGRSWEV